MSLVSSRHSSTLPTISCSSRIWERTRASVEKPVLPRRFFVSPSSSKRTSASCWGEPIVNSWPASSKISAWSFVDPLLEALADLGEALGVEHHPDPLHLRQDLDQRHLDLVHQPFQVLLLHRLALALGDLPDEAGLGGGVGRRLLAQLELAVAVCAIGLLGRGGEAALGGDVDQVVGAARRVEQVGADHRVVAEVEPILAGGGEEAVLGAATETLQVVPDQPPVAERLRKRLELRAIPARPDACRHQPAQVAPTIARATSPSARS